MLRDDWEFEYRTADLAAAADKKRQHAEERLAWWTKKKEEVFAKIRSEGLDIDESLAEQYSSFSNKGAFGPRVVVRDDFQRDLNECAQKITEWGTKLRDYEGWHQVLSAQQPYSTLKLDHADWLHFFGQ